MQEVHGERPPREEKPPEAPALHVAMASPEVAPFAKTGGLADVLGALPQALERLGVRVSLILPAYRCVLQGGFPREDTGITFTLPVSGGTQEARLLRARVGRETPVYLMRADRYFDRDHLYGTPEGDYPDNAERFVFFSRAVLEVLRLDPPQVLHCHDWQSALAITFLKCQPHLYPELRPVKTVFTVHNVGYQGVFWHLDWHLLGLGWEFFTPKYLEFYGKINFLKGGLAFADAIATVSPTYAQEVQTPEVGLGLDGVFRERAGDLLGILNGVDYDTWNPRFDGYIAKPYGPRSLSGKGACKGDLQQSLGLSVDPDVPLLGMVSRLTPQKGVDLLQEAIEGLLQRGVQFALLGAGDQRYEEFFGRLPALYPGRAGVHIGFDEALAHKVVAGADMLLMPSRYEPCGLNQIYSLKYGTVPIVRATGGLKDTVEPFDRQTGKGTGFLFRPYEVSAFLEAVDQALALYPQKGVWRAVMRNAMAADFSWKRPAQEYLALYRRLLGA